MAVRLPKMTKILYGGDYNPEQWLDYPEILEKDIEMLKKAHINTVSLGIFSWAVIEPEEGKYDFSFLRERINTLYENGISTILATPSGARPRWLSDKYPEVLRVNEMGVRAQFGFRHNHCYTSPVYREKIAALDTALAKEFGNHPGVIAWHINNEMGGECYCDLCQNAFRDWLKEKYGTIEEVNKAWNLTFWSHRVTSFDQIDAPSPRGELFVHGLNLDWKRFISDRHKDFTRVEKAAIKAAGSDLPVTINMMYNFQGIDYVDFADEIDFASWDNYATWHKYELYETALDTEFEHDRIRSVKRGPFIMMECCPTSTNWQKVSKLRAPGILAAQMLQPVAHGADGSLYFQMRQSRGASEKFHGAVIDHYGKEDTRIFREATESGAMLENLAAVIGSETKTRVAVLYDQENRWALEDAQGPRNVNMLYRESVQKSYKAFRKYGLNVDLIDESQEFHYEAPGSDVTVGGYAAIAVPMMYLTRCDIEERLRVFVEDGGTVFFTYWSGIVGETDLTHLGGTPHRLMNVVGYRSTEIDGLYDGTGNTGVLNGKNRLGLKDSYTCEHFCELEELHGAEALMVYGEDWYQGYPALTEHTYGDGKVYGICADFEQEFYDDLYRAVMKEIGVEPILTDVPAKVAVTSREAEDGKKFIFLQNWNEEAVDIALPAGAKVLYGDQAGHMEKYAGFVFEM